jgi:hypothetical protein
VDIISLIIGFVIGIVAVSMAIELGWRKEPSQETCKLTENWSLHELRNPLIMAEKLRMDVPENAKVVVAHKSLVPGEVKEHPEVRSNFALGENRALIFTGEIKKGEIALWTIDEQIMRKLRREFERLWGVDDESLPPAPSVPSREVSEEIEDMITVVGRVRARVPFREGYLLRLSTENRVMGIMIDEPMDLKGKTVEVTGTLTNGNHPLIRASRITVIDTDIETVT